jgi:hypothetical protein
VRNTYRAADLALSKARGESRLAQLFSDHRQTASRLRLPQSSRRSLVVTATERQVWLHPRSTADRCRISCVGGTPGVQNLTESRRMAP